ncbi:hypothetical protein BaOVIS_004100 [Babesia ovis]|uniref:Uncharacterized protein n=1 Tax=Babesia ovis TaxID=5869 RepID=A0A9W5WTN7_BABOV|nr:hypothetical protein BaOVIS_004100 [Babesia ovis]
MEETIRSFVKLLGISDYDVPAEIDILKGKNCSAQSLHKLTVALSLAHHFDRYVSFTSDIDVVKLDDAKLRLIIESLNGETKCSTHDALNILTYTTLEYLQYPRLAKINLDVTQDARELFLAFIFLLSKQKWFDRIGERCPVYLNFRKSLLNAVAQELEPSTANRNSDTTMMETVADKLAILWDKRMNYRAKCSAELINRSNDIIKANVESNAASVLTDRSTQLHFLRATEQYGLCEQRFGSHLACEKRGITDTYIKSKIPASNLHIADNCGDMSIRDKVSVKTTSAVRPFQKTNTSVSTEDSIDTNISTLFDEINCAVSRTVMDFEAKSQLLCRCKNAETFDSELLRVIIGQSQQQVVFNNLMDTIDRSTTNSSPKENRGLHVFQRGRKTQSMNKSAADDLGKSEQQNQSIVDEILDLNHTIIQLQSRVKRLANSVEQGDVERLKHFTRLSEKRKVYDRQTNNKQQETTVNNALEIKECYNMPSPAEWVLIAQKEPFERHLAILKMIDKSLDDESKRSLIFESGLSILKQIKPEPANKRPYSKTITPNATISLVTIPNKIKENVNILKSFIVEGIPTDNFDDKAGQNANQCKQCAKDFLRQINSNFLNYRSAVSASKGKKGFQSYITNTLNQAETEGVFSKDEYSKTKAMVDKMLHLFEDAAKHDPPIYFECLSEWIHPNDNNLLPEELSKGLKNDDCTTRVDLTSVEREIHDFKVLSQLVNQDLTPEPPYNVWGDDRKDSSTQKKSIFDFDHYFNLVREECASKESNDASGMEPPFLFFDRLLKKHSDDISQLQAASIIKSKTCIDQIYEQLPSLIFLD